MTPEQAETQLFEQTLSSTVCLRAGFSPQTLAADEAERLCGQAEAQLNAIALVEDSHAEEDEPIPGGATLRRLEAKLDLLISLVAGLAHARQTDPPMSLRWSARGACFAHPQALPPGSRGVFRLQAAVWLPEPLSLPAVVLASQPDTDGGRLWVQFDPLTPTLAAALERHLFRLHRRAVAERRRGG
jgi:hypothetical protein